MHTDMEEKDMCQEHLHCAADHGSTQNRPWQTNVSGLECVGWHLNEKQTSCHTKSKVIGCLAGWLSWLFMGLIRWSVDVGWFPHTMAPITINDVQGTSHGYGRPYAQGLYPYQVGYSFFSRILLSLSTIIF